MSIRAAHPDSPALFHPAGALGVVNRSRGDLSPAGKDAAARTSRLLAPAHPRYAFGAMSQNANRNAIAEDPPAWPRHLPPLLGYVMAVGPAATDMYLPAFPAVEASLRAAPGGAQFTLAAWFAGLAVGQILVGTLSDRHGRRRPLAAGFALFALAMACSAVAPSIAVMSVLRFIAAIGASSGMVISRAVVRDVADGQRGALLMSRLTVIQGVAPIIAPMLGAGLLAIANWQMIFWVQALYGLSCTVLVWSALPETLPESRRIRVTAAQMLVRYAGIATEPVFVTHAIMMGGASFCLFAYLGGSSPVFIQGFGLSPAAFGGIFGFCAIGLVLGARINTRLLPRFGLSVMLRAIAAVALAATAMLLAVSLSGTHVVWLVIAPIFVAMACQGFSNGNTVAGALTNHAAHAGSASALLGVFQYVMGSVSGLLVGILTDGTPRGMALLMVCGALTAAIADRFRPRA